jgi:7-cyano-7-deazaguanine synthase
LEKRNKAIVILSGGMDSATALAYAVSIHGAKNVYALTFDYGQRHAKEMKAAAALAGHYEVKHLTFRIFLDQIGGSALTDKNIPVPEFKADEDVWKRTKVALSYVPFRNTIFVSIAVAYAEALGCKYIYTGFNYIDSGGYPDTRPDYLDALNRLITLGSRDKPTVIAPLITMTKKEIVQFGETLGVPWRLTWSCYEGKDRPCGKCNACIQRAKGFAEANVRDPLISAITHKEEYL